MAKIMLKNVRLSFPSLFKRSEFDGKEGKYEATFLLNKSDEKTYNILKDAIDAALAEAKIKVPSDKYFLKDGDESEYNGYAGHWSIKASNSSRPLLINKDKSMLTADDEKLYPGCYVNAEIAVWVQSNKFGKRVNANLYGVQFWNDGENLGGDFTSDIDAFDSAED